MFNLCERYVCTSCFVSFQLIYFRHFNYEYSEFLKISRLSSRIKSCRVRNEMIRNHLDHLFWLTMSRMSAWRIHRLQRVNQCDENIIPCCLGLAMTSSCGDRTTLFRSICVLFAMPQHRLEVPQRISFHDEIQLFFPFISFFLSFSIRFVSIIVAIFSIKFNAHLNVNHGATRHLRFNWSNRWNRPSEV